MSEITSNGVGLFYGMGTGKSLTAISITNILEAKRVLILCPSSVVGVWPREFKKFSGNEFAVTPLRDVNRKSPLSVAEKHEIAESALRAQDDRDARTASEYNPDSESEPMGTVVIVNYESAWREPLAELLMNTKWDLIILDESHKIKSPSGKASKFCHKLATQTRFKLALTGTEQPHSPLDVFSQYKFLNPKIFGTSFNGFKQRYAVTNSWNTVTGFVNLEDMKTKIETIAHRVNEEDANLNLPEATHIVIPTDIHGEARKMHEEILEGLWVQLDAADESGESEAVKATIVVAQLTRCAQVTGGFVGGVLNPDLPEDQQVPQTRRIKGASKAKALNDIIESIQNQSQGKDNDHKLVVFCRFKEDLAQIEEVATKNKLTYGEISGNSKSGLASDSTMADDCDILGVQLQAGGVGIDLTAARYVVYWNKDFSFGNYEQSLKRAHRPGQKHPVTFYHFVAPNTIDERIEDSLSSKESVVEWFRTRRNSES